MHFFARGDVASRIVSLLPEETWKEPPVVYETEDDTETPFEKTWESLLSQMPLYSYLQRADILSGVGQYGVLLLGISDGKPLSEPVDTINEMGQPVGLGTGDEPRYQLLYLRPLEEYYARIDTYETDINNPRFGLPLYYTLTFLDNNTQITQRAHWSRVLHLADNRTNSDVFGLPRMKVVFNRLLDLRKIAGGSGEMFWKGGFPGLSLESQPTDDEFELDVDATKEQIESYMNGLQRYIATMGMTAKSLSVQVADPIPHMELQLRLIATAIGVPWRVLAGSEAAQLASEQDSQNWNGRVARRRESYVSPFVLRPFVDRLIAMSILPEPVDGYLVAWPGVNTPSPEQLATVSEKKTNAIAKYVQAGADALMPPYYFLTLILGMEDKEAKALIADSLKQTALLADRGAGEDEDNAEDMDEDETSDTTR